MRHGFVQISILGFYKNINDEPQLFSDIHGYKIPEHEGDELFPDRSRYNRYNARTEISVRLIVTQCKCNPVYIAVL